MTTKRTTSSKAGAKKLKVRKETIKDLDAKRGSVKGGAATTIVCLARPQKLQRCSSYPVVC